MGSATGLFHALKGLIIIDTPCCVGHPVSTGNRLQQTR